MDKLGKLVADTITGTQNAIPVVKALAASSAHFAKDAVSNIELGQITDKSAHLAQDSLAWIQAAAAEIDIKQSASTATTWVAEHPWQAGEVAGTAVLCLLPGFVATPALTWLGFGAKGVVGGSAATGLQPLFNPVVARGLFATLQSAGAGGYGVAAVHKVVRGTVVVVQGVKYFVTSSRR